MTQLSESEPGPEQPVDRGPEAPSIRLPASLLAQAQRLAAADGVTLEEFVAAAVAHYAGFLEGRSALEQLGAGLGAALGGGSAAAPSADELMTRLASDIGLGLYTFGFPPAEADDEADDDADGDRTDVTSEDPEAPPPA